MLSFFEIIKLSFRLIGFKYTFLIFLAISLTSSLLLFTDGILKSYEKSLLVKIIGSTPHVSVLFDGKLSGDQVDETILSIKESSPVKFTSRGLAYSGTADIFTVGIADNLDSTEEFDSDWKQEELKSQSPEVFFKGMLSTPVYDEYLEKVLLGFKSFDERSQLVISEIYTYKDPVDWDQALVYRKPIAFPPSLYREIIDPYISQANYPFINFTQPEKIFDEGAEAAKKPVEFVVVAGLDTPISDDTVPIVSAYETMEYLLYGTTKGDNLYNYIELYLDDPMSAKSVSENIDSQFQGASTVSAWSDKFKSEVALISIFSFLFISVLVGVGITIGLLVSSLLDITVRRKRRQISVLMSMGAESKLIYRIFVYYSVVVGFLSFIASFFVTGVMNWLLIKFIHLDKESLEGMSLVSLLHHKISNVPEPGGIGLYISLVLFLSIICICLLSSYHSAIEASKLNPIDGLKES